MSETPHSPSLSTPTPDPTVATTQQLQVALQSERDYVDGQIQVLSERLRGIDAASTLLGESVNAIPEAAISKLRELMDERFASIRTQFLERDTRQERESRDNKVAVDAAFAAQKEAAAKQEDNFRESIAKSEQATKETIDKLQALTATERVSLSDKIDDLKQRVQGIESRSQGAGEQRQQTREGISTLQGVLGIIAVVILLIGVIITANLSTNTPPQVVTVTTQLVP